MGAPLKKRTVEQWKKLWCYTERYETLIFYEIDHGTTPKKMEL